MNKSLIAGLAAGAVVATAGAAFAGYALKHNEPTYAQVVEVQPVQRTIRTPRQECHDEVVARPAPSKGSKKVSSTPGTTTEKRCVTVYDTHIERKGYDVRYRIGDREGTVRMSHDPGDRIPLRQGQLVLDARAG